MDHFLDDDNDSTSYYYDYDPFWNMSNVSISGDFDSDWCEADEQQERTIKMFQTCVFCLIFPLGVAGNLLVIATFTLYRRLHLRSMTDVFLFHLALADLLLLLTVPLLAVDTHLGWIFSSLLCKITRACYAVNTYSGLLLLACISVDRYMVVARPQQILQLRSKVLTAGKVAAVGVWLVAVLLSLPEILFSGVSGSGSEAYCGMNVSGRVKMVTDGAMIAVFCASFFVMVTCYSSVASVLCKGYARRRGRQWPRQRTLKLMLTLVVVFLLFQLPYTVVLSRKMAGGLFCGLMLDYITCTLAFTRCSLNPLLYAMVGVRFRQDVLRLVRDVGGACGIHLKQRVLNSTSNSFPSNQPPTSPDRTGSNDTPASNNFHFMANK
ncbi:C-C chemokine receptor type 10 [Gouania willdenowi]|uniref:C-C chemokine receptor type 7-like n=1 Tax=Gouania willdenowi TaxID=441366 RepID=A0A8C5GTU4_GOUWI|nr:C-C chemokine receptor type 7-like [Gouania willdenowi]